VEEGPLSQLDFAIVAVYLALTLAWGAMHARRASESSEQFFVAGRSLPWWLAGTSIVATTFAADTPLAIAGLVATGGIAANWFWWADVLPVMIGALLVSHLWRRSGVLTDNEIVELRYGGRTASGLRIFRALYLGVVRNAIVIGWVNLAMVKVLELALGLDEESSRYVLAGLFALTVGYTLLAGLLGVVLTDALQFGLALGGCVMLAVFAVGEAGGLDSLLSSLSDRGDTLRMVPLPSDGEAFWAFLIYVGIKSWASGNTEGNGYTAQRILATRSERDARLASLWYGVAHFALRPWPWIIVALCSIVVYPTVDSIAAAFPGLDPSILGEDMAYSAMLVLLPTGLLGLVVASLAAAYMSTISTHLNWGASYIVDDFYRRFIRNDASEKHYVTVGRFSTVFLVSLACVVALWLEDAKTSFEILLQIGAGTGMIYLARWFWWRINAWSELSAMVISFLVAIYFQFVHTAIGFEAIDASLQLVLGVLLTSVGWVTVTFLTAPVEAETLRSFHALIRPMGGGWAGAGLGLEPDEGDSPTAAFLAWFLGLTVVYGAIFGTGYLLYGQLPLAGVCLATAGVAGGFLMKTLPRVGIR